MKKLTLTLILVVLLTVPTYAINGHISLEYDTLNKTGQGEIYLYEDYKDIRIGGRMVTDLMGFNLKGGFIPAGIPESQTYDLIIDYRFTDNITFTFIEGCKHYFAQSNYTRWQDEVYIKLKAKYKS